MTYLEEVEETLGTPTEVEPLDETQLEDLGLNTCNHDLPLSFREVPSFDESEPQPQPLSNCPPLDVGLVNERGLKPPGQNQSKTRQNRARNGKSGKVKVKVNQKLTKSKSKVRTKPESKKC
nr:hypothetical protein [Tanacetum cinerariifolium]